MKIGIAKKDAKQLRKQEICGKYLLRLTEETLTNFGIGFGSIHALLAARRHLLFWGNATIHGVILAPSCNTARSKTIEENIHLLRGSSARSLLGGLDQIFQYMVC